MPVADPRAEIATLIERDAAHNASWFDYGEVRPIPYARYKAEKWKVKTDCSGWYGCMCYVAGAPNPFGLSWASGDGFTGNLLSYLKPITLSHVKPGDCVVFGAYPGLHVAVFQTRGDVKTPMVGSFGAPGQPHVLSFAQEAAGFPGRTVTILQLPVKPATETVWVVRNGKGEMLGTTKRPAAWGVRHPRSYRKYGIVTYHREERSQ